MEGRWTITYTHGRQGLLGFLPALRTIDGPETEAVPVVPCDDAAVERAARVIALWTDHPSQVARAVLRAAGDPEA